jgi:hypothetical protein
MQRQKYILPKIGEKRELMLMTLPNRQRMCSTADESGAYTSRRYSCSIVAQEVE